MTTPPHDPRSLTEWRRLARVSQIEADRRRAARRPLVPWPLVIATLLVALAIGLVYLAAVLAASNN